MSMKWWEKTVEYKFVALMARHSPNFLAPLDGSHELAGDALFATQNKWILIEFKKDQQSIKDEKKKFTNFEAAKTVLKDRDGHHLLIYGYEKMQDGKSDLSLIAKTYFSENAKKNQEEICNSGAEFKVFTDYVDHFIEFKRSPHDGGVGIKMLRDFALVAGVGADGQIVTCVSLNEFQMTRGLDKQLRLERTMNRGMSR